MQCWSSSADEAAAAEDAVADADAPDPAGADGTDADAAAPVVESAEPPDPQAVSNRIDAAAASSADVRFVAMGGLSVHRRRRPVILPGIRHASSPDQARERSPVTACRDHRGSVPPEESDRRYITAARPASSRATGTRNGEQDT